MPGSGSVYKLGLRLQFFTSFVAIGFVVWGWFEFLGEKGITSSQQEGCDVSVISRMEPKSMDQMLTPLERKRHVHPRDYVPVVPHEAVAEVSRRGKL